MRNFDKVIAAAWVVLLAASAATASSHREAPNVSQNPRVDITDVYAFRSYDVNGVSDPRATIIANFMPFQIPEGGPNYFAMDPRAAYQIHIDNDGDGVEDITFRIRFEHVYQPDLVTTDDGTPVENPFYHRPAAPIAVPEDPGLNLVERYVLELHQGAVPDPSPDQALNSTTGESFFIKPMEYLGPDSFSNYEDYATQHVYDFQTPQGSGKIFVGQRQEPFQFDLGQAFDSLELMDPLTSANVRSKNITSFALEVPVEFLRESPMQPVVGIWATAMLPQVRQLNPNPSNPNDVDNVPPGTPDVQVSRMGMPLFNKLFVGLGLKDTYNANPPTNDAAFEQFLSNPAAAALLGAPSANRTDLVELFFLGIPALATDFGVPADMLRLNLETQPTPLPAQNPAGALGVRSDPAGFPNGRRPVDDVVDVVVMTLVGPGQPIPEPPFRADEIVPLDQFPFMSPPVPGFSSSECVELVASTNPQSGFAAVPGAIADPQDGSAILFPLGPDPIEFFLVEPGPNLPLLQDQIRLEREGADQLRIRRE